MTQTFSIKTCVSASRSLKETGAKSSLCGFLGWLCCLCLSTGSVCAETTSPAPPSTVSPKVTEATTASTNSVKSVSTNAVEISISGNVGTGAATAEGKTNLVSKTTGVTYESFKIVQERNIFDPKRTSRSSRASARAASEAKKVVKVETFSLVGILNSASGDFAFFEGSSSEFKKVARPKDSFAGFRITEVTPNLVSLMADGKTNRLSVGARMKRQDDGPWEMASAGETIVASSSDSSSASEDKGSTGGDSASDSGESDILKRLRLKRERELKNEK